MTNIVSIPDAAAPKVAPGWQKARRLARDHITFVVFGLITLFFILHAPNFASLATANAIGRITAVVSIMAVGMTMVIMCREIDLSVGALAQPFGHGWRHADADRDQPWLSIPIMTGFGALIGLANGLIVTRLRIPSFLATLACSASCRAPR